jgi:hypothetical protein
MTTRAMTTEAIASAERAFRREIERDGHRDVYGYGMQLLAEVRRLRPGLPPDLARTPESAGLARTSESAGNRFEGGTLEYKCRRCGEIERGTHAPSVATAVVSIVINGRDPWGGGITARMQGTHACPDGGVGVTDLVGGTRDKPEPEGS